MSEKAKYITCPLGHKIYVIWSDQKQCFGFTCDECKEHSQYAVSAHGTIVIKVLSQGGRA